MPQEWTHSKLVSRKIRDEEFKRFENERTAEKKVNLLRTSTENEDPVTERNNGLEVKTFREGTRTTLKADLWGTPHHLIRFFSQSELCLRDQQSE